MLINALVDYYNILENKGRIPSNGYCKQNIHYKILIDENGIIQDIVSCMVTEKQIDNKGKEKEILKPISENFPKRNQKPGIASEILEHRPKYIFGLSFDNKTNKYNVLKDKKGRLTFDVFKETNLDFIKDVDSSLAKAFMKFIENWDPSKEIDNAILKKISKTFEKSSFCFAQSGNPKKTLQRDDAVKEKWNSICKMPIEGGIKGTCAITGEKNTVIARIHDNKIKGIVGGQASGCVLIGTNNPAEESYGKVQAYNSSISTKAALKYTTALNYLLAAEKPKHKMRVDDTTIVFWAADEKADDKCSALFGDIMNDSDAEGLDLDLENVFNQLKEGMRHDSSFIDKYKNVDFYIAGMTPNNSRVSIRFVYKNTFGKLFDSVCKHYYDMMLKETKKTSQLWMIKKELVSPKSTNAKVPPSITSDLFKAIIFGYDYPISLLSTLIRRIKTDKTENVIRIGLLKAYINRNKRKEIIKMGLDENNTNVAYLCGRLFALLEYIQCRAATTKLNRTIKDSYFTSACSNPAIIFPTISKLSEHHMKKIQNNIWLDKKKGEIFSKLNHKFPTTLSLIEQGTFIIGYYQQKQDLYTKKEEDKKNESNQK